MHVSELSIRNAVLPVMLAAAMIVFGYLGYRELGISQFPELDFPVVNVTTTREAASPDIVDADVTEVIESAVSGVEGIDYVSSQSTEGTSVVTVYFHLYRDVDAAMQDVQNAVSAAARRLPTDIDPPVVSKVNFNKFPVMWLAVHGSRPLNEINRIVDERLKTEIETVPGCGGLFYGGLRQRNMRVWLDGKKLQAHNLDVREVAQALRRTHVEKPAGYLQSDRIEINVRTMGEARTARDFEELIVAERGGRIVRLKDVATIEDGLVDKRSFARFNSIPNVGVGIMRAKGANVVAVCDAVKAKLPRLRELLPDGLQIGISVDYSMFIRKDVNELKFTLTLGVILTALVAYLFLGSVGSTLNICLAIPTSLIGSFCVMHYLGFTVNFMTLLALSLSVGVVVDDAILVLENIHRRRENGEPMIAAALAGAKEISFAAVAATLSIIAIFLPVAFMEGSIGRFFYEFGVTVSVAVALSLVTSLTLTPMLCSKFLKIREPGRPMPRQRGGFLGAVGLPLRRAFWFVDRWILEPALLGPTNFLLERLARGYARVVEFGLRWKSVVVVASALLMLAAFVFLEGVRIPLPGALASWLGRDAIDVAPIGRELVPSEDQNRFVISVYGPVGTNIEYMDDALTRVEAVLRNMPELASFFSAVSTRPGQLVSEGMLFCRLVERERRHLTQSAVMTEVRQRLAAIPGIRAVVLDLSTQGFTATRGYPIDFAIQGPDWEKVTQFGLEIQRQLTLSGYVTDVNSDYRPGMLEVRIVPDRQKAAEMGVPMRDLAYAVNALVGGVRVGRYTTDNGKRYDVRIRTIAGQRDTPSEISNLFVRSLTGKLVAVADCVRLEPASTLPVINRYNHQRKVEITANPAPGVSQGTALAACQEIAESVVPPGYTITSLGNAKAMGVTIRSMTFALLLGLVIAYMVLGVQFNSFLHPFTVLLAMPFAATGALATLWVCGDTLNLMSMIGLVLLMGLVKKNSIILVDYFNQLRGAGLSLEDAVRTGCPIRLRPILMTSLATIAGALPLALGVGPGAETRAPLARGIIGGIALSTLVTLVVVPVFYVLLDRLSSWITHRVVHPAEPLVERPIAGDLLAAPSATQGS